MTISFSHFQKYLKESLDTIPDMSHLIPQEGTQYGSNPGGIHVDPSSKKKYYVKFYRDPEQAKVEQVASKVYNEVGVHNLQPRVIHHNGRIALATEWRGDLKRHSPKELNNAPAHMHPQLADHFHAAVLTKNWDAIGLEHDNVMSDHSGKLHCVDMGGSMHFRAMGGPKPYGSDIDEHSSLRERGRPAGDVFSKIPHDVLKASAQKMHNLTDEKIDSHTAILKNGESVAKSMKARRDAIINKYA